MADLAHLMCFARDEDQLSPDSLPSPAESIAQAIEENPRNASLTPPNRLVFADSDPAPEGATALALYMSKFWQAGRELKIGFVGGSEWQQLQVKNYAPQWTQYANIKFTFVTSGECQIVVDFNPNDGSWSSIGTDGRSRAAQRQRTMNLGWIDPDRSSDDQIRGTILHEFGHALGSIHEHQSPKFAIPWKKEVVYKALADSQGWDRAKVDINMFTKYTLQEVQATNFDPASIMIYAFPMEWTEDGSFAKKNYDLSEFDKKYARFCYPPSEYDAQQYHISETRAVNRAEQLNKKLKYYYKRYDAPPQLALALTSIDVPRDTNLRIKATATDLNIEGFMAHLDSWNDSTIFSASMSFLEKVPGRFDYLQMGTYNTIPDNKVARPENAKRIDFTAPFAQAPKVVTFLNMINESRGRNWRVKVYVDNIDTNGFTLHIDAWADTIFNAAEVTWLAYPADQPNVASGHFSTDDIRDWSAPRHENVGTATFAKPFDRVPKVFMGLDTFDFASSANLRLRLSTSAVTPTSLTWHLQSYSDSVMYRSGGSYFAWA